MSAFGTASAPARETQLVDGEYPFTARDFAAVRELLHADSGIHLPDSKATLVYSRLAKRLRKLGIATFADYCAHVASPDGAGERRQMLTALTTNVTRFYREPHHFDHLKRQVARWAPAVRKGGRLRLWSAGCSTGQEPYSMAMVLLEALPDAASLDVRILATDIDPAVVQTAREGRYSAEAIEPVPPEARRAFLKAEDGRWAVSDALRELIVFNELNLMSPSWPIRGRFQAIFCRNVAIYFEGAAQEGLWGRLSDALTADGRLYIGHSERVNEGRLVSDGVTVYRHKGAAA
jgi:chemotaxis protein methyltransferase CheR